MVEYGRLTKYVQQMYKAKTMTQLNRVCVQVLNDTSLSVAEQAVMRRCADVREVKIKYPHMKPLEFEYE